jgi:glycine oxidase
VVLTAGAWSSTLIEDRSGHDLSVRPVRGQAIEVRSAWSAGPNLRFEVPGAETEYHAIAKGAGRAWVGSTVEDVGFDARVTETGIQELLRAARTVLPGLRESDVLESRVGLRPQARRPGGPFLGPLPGFKNVWVACGHYRSGIHTGPISASLLVREMLGEETPLDLAPFGVGTRNEK